VKDLPEGLQPHVRGFRDGRLEAEKFQDFISSIHSGRDRLTGSSPSS